MDLAIGEIVYMDENQILEVEQVVEINPENVKQLKKPITPRSPVYKFFEWDEAKFKWKCTTCG